MSGGLKQYLLYRDFSYGHLSKKSEEASSEEKSLMQTRFKSREFQDSQTANSKEYILIQGELSSELKT